MPDTMILLQFEHRTMTSLLGIVRQQVAHLKRGAPVNYDVLASAFAYLADYPDQCHHPKEDVIYKRLLDRHPNPVPAIGDLTEDHARLAAATRDLGRVVEASRSKAAVANGELARRLDQFVDAYRRHMAAEEEHFFPAARKYLSTDDWADIDFAVFDRSDPLIDQATEERFADLRSEIRRLDAAGNAAAAGEEEAQRLSGMVDVATFNEAMERLHEPLRLAHAPQGGYRLERGGKILAEIPECSETRAAWCGYFFWKGIARQPGR